MLRTMSYASQDHHPPGEADAWDAAAERRRRAVLRSGFAADERHRADDFARRDTHRRPPPSRSASARESGARSYRGLPSPASAEDFRDLARIIEQQRRRQSEPSERDEKRYASRGSSAHASAARSGRSRNATTPSSRHASSPRVRPADDAPARQCEPRSFNAVARDAAHAVDRHDFLRLEKLLNEVLERLAAFDQPRAATHCTTCSRGEDHAGRAEGSAPQPEPAPRQRTESRRTPGRPSESQSASESRPREDARTAERRRVEETKRPSDYAAQEAQSDRAAARGTRPRRLFT